MVRDKYLILNTGSTSTKVTVFNDQGDRTVDRTVQHPTEELNKYERVQDQYQLRCDNLAKALEESELCLDEVIAVGARGGTLIPIYEDGTFLVDEYMCQTLIHSTVEHAANLGAQIAKYFADKAGTAAYVVDPDVLDEMSPIARICGLKGVERGAQWHGLSQKAIVRKLAAELGKPHDEITAIVLHIGGGVSVGLHINGKAVDVNNCIHGDGPFSPERAGLLPTIEVLNLVFEKHMSLAEVKKELVGNGGLVSHLGTNDAREVERMIEDGDEYAKLVYEAMTYNFAKSIGALAAAAKGKVDAIGVTGGMAYSDMMMEWLREYVAFIAPIFIYPGEREMEAIYQGIWRVEQGLEDYKQYRVKERPE